MRAIALAVMLLPFTAGCFAHRSVPFTTVQEGDHLLVGITDQGRVTLSSTLGEGADRLRGVVQSRSDTSLVLQVHSVQYIRGRTEQWAGEPVRLTRPLVSGVTERRLARGRTWLTVGGTAAAIAAFAIALDFGSTGSRGTGRTPTPPGIDH